ncbi:unnamed protein product [Diplocarpon coronariae]
MGPQQKPPRSVEARNATTQNPATLIFGHGYGADADGFISTGHQFQAAQKLPHLTWIFPNAPHNHETMTDAWYESESEIWDSVDYIDAEVSRGVPAHRIVAGGLSQGQREGTGKVFLAHGTRDMMVPVRMFREAKRNLGLKGIGHVAGGLEFRDMCAFLGRVVPE